MNIKLYDLKMNSRPKDMEAEVAFRSKMNN